jgi:hypothetical protein
VLEMRVLAADAEWPGQQVIIAARPVREPSDVGSLGAACVNRDRLCWTHSHVASLCSLKGTRGVFHDRQHPFGATQIRVPLWSLRCPAN